MALLQGMLQGAAGAKLLPSVDRVVPAGSWSKKTAIRGEQVQPTWLSAMAPE